MRQKPYHFAATVYQNKVVVVRQEGGRDAVNLGEELLFPGGREGPPRPVQTVRAEGVEKGGGQVLHARAQVQPGETLHLPESVVETMPRFSFLLFLNMERKFIMKRGHIT